MTQSPTPRDTTSRDTTSFDQVARDASIRDPAQQDLSEVKTALSGLQFGSVNIIVQDGYIIQIDRTEKRRLQPPSK
ncbi:MAG: YezD family protein [Pirellulales bacterium]